MGFSWENFGIIFLKEVIRGTDNIDNKDLYMATDDLHAVIGCMNMICDKPDRNFVIKYRQIIEHYVLSHYPEEIKNICAADNIVDRSFNKKQAKMTKKSMSVNLANAYCSALFKISNMDVKEQDYSNFRYTRSLNMSKTSIEDVPLYDYQKDAVEALTNHFITKDQSTGMLVMPTGSGKSRTATYFLIKEMVSRGYQILWLVHRHMLIDQAADCFYRFAGLSKIENPNIRNYRISCISGEHLKMSQSDKHEIVIASIRSVCRNKKHLRRILGRKVVIVVDEAHHALAPTYKDIIKFVQKIRKYTKLLGLTATPVRANELDSNALMKIFDNNIVYSIAMSNLIAKGVLASPVFVRRETGADFEPMCTIDEEKFLRKYGELPQTLISKIASSNVRNKIIVGEYLDNKEKYGKTLIFALNILQCRFLCEELQNNGVKCGCIFSGLEDNTGIINDFKNGDIDVLINVNIMTEGTDVPDIQTVFLTRPTQSEGFLMQMIGRGLRGIEAGGTAEAYIIDFHDTWTVFNKWLNPQWLLEEEEIPDIQKKRGHHEVIYQEYEWKMCQDIYNSLVFENYESGRAVMLPVGWYTLKDEDGEIVRMLFFENQLSGFLKMMKDKATWQFDYSFTPPMALHKYFQGFLEQPPLYELSLLMNNIRHNGEQPVRYLLANRKTIEPLYVAEKAEQEHLDVIELASNIYDSHDIVKELYSSKKVYISKVCDMKEHKDNKLIIGRKVEELAAEIIPFDRTPFYELDELVEEVKNEMFKGTYDGLGRISWTDKPYKKFYGRHWKDTHDIEINCILNSKDVKRDVVKYVIYHEMLHKENMTHNTAFRKEEHKYPKWAEWEHFLDDNMTKFDIQEW